MESYKVDQFNKEKLKPEVIEKIKKILYDEVQTLMNFAQSTALCSRYLSKLERSLIELNMNYYDPPTEESTTDSKLDILFYACCILDLVDSIELSPPEESSSGELSSPED